MKTLQQLLLQALARYASLTALADERGDLSYAQLADRAARARAMLFRLGLAVGDRVGIIGANSVDYVIVDVACFTGGLVRVGINRRSSVAEVDAMARTVGLSVLFADGEWLPRLRDGLSDGVAVLPLDADDRGRPLRDRLLAEAPTKESARLEPSMPAALVFTSGTTGAPKAITVTQGNLAATVRNVLIEVPVSHDVSVLQPIPLSHAAMQLSVAFLSRGARQRLLGVATPAQILDELAAGRHSILTSVPTVVAMLAGEQCATPRDLAALRAVVYGGSAMSGEQMRAAVAAFGPTLYQIYAQSESSLPLTCLDPHDHVLACSDDPRLIASAGRPGPFMELAIMAPDGRFLPPGEAGEIVVRGETVTPGYRGDPEATAAVLDADSWLHTGDVGYRSEDDYVFIVDRLKDMIISGGFNVFPAEVEQALTGVAGIRELAVYGVPDEKWGERVCVAVVADEEVTLEDLQQAARQTLAAYKIPREIRQYPQLPVSATGKILRRQLRTAHHA